MLIPKKVLPLLTIFSLLIGISVIHFSIGIDQTKAATVATEAMCGDRALPFAKYSAKVSVICDEISLYLSTNSLPDHEMMVGITGWNQQVPIPPVYSGSLLQMWKIPLKPVVASTPALTNGIGGTGFTVNGVPLYNPVKPSQGGNGSVYTTASDLKLLGELDVCDGHSGKGDDYHYHAAPTCLIKALASEGAVVGYQLDGYAVYGFNEPSGKQASGLDACNGHDSGDTRGYHYHFTAAAPYSPMCYHGVIPSNILPGFGQPTAQGMQPAGVPITVLITKMSLNLTGTSKLEFTYQGKEGSVSWSPAASANCWNFTYVNPPPGSPGTGTKNNICRKEAALSGSRQQGGQQQGAPPSGQQAPEQKFTTLYKKEIVTELTCLKGSKKKVVTTTACPSGYKLLSKKKVTKLIPTEVPVVTQGGPQQGAPQQGGPQQGGPQQGGPQQGAPQQGAPQQGGPQQGGPQQGGPQQGGPQQGGSKENFETVVKSSDGKFKVVSSAVADEGQMPIDYVCNEISTKTGVSPPLSWSGEPKETKSFVVMMYNYNSAGASKYRYSWIVYNIPGSTHEILKANSTVGTFGTSDHGAGYSSPCSPGPKGTTKQYTVKVYALSQTLSLTTSTATASAILAAVKDITLASAAINMRHVNLTDANPSPK
jgi:phosphatidylethanolamine-binding protein (PEBP) family uncharacterized protein